MSPVTEERLFVALERLPGALESDRPPSVEVRAGPAFDPAACTVRIDAVTQLCVDGSSLGKLLGLSESTIGRLDDVGRIPSGIKLGRSKRWFLEEIHEWLRAGAPPRKQWLSIREEILRSGVAAPRLREGGLSPTKRRQ